MMYRKTCLFIVLSMIVPMAQADDKCVVPETPAIPVGSVSEERLMSAISTFKKYQIDLATFRTCVDSKKVIIDEKSMDKETVEKNRQINAGLDMVYNESVDREHSIADRLNAEIKLYKSTHEHKDR